MSIHILKDIVPYTVSNNVFDANFSWNIVDFCRNYIPFASPRFENLYTFLISDSKFWICDLHHYANGTYEIKDEIGLHVFLNYNDMIDYLSDLLHSEITSYCLYHIDVA